VAPFSCVAVKRLTELNVDSLQLKRLRLCLIYVYTPWVKKGATITMAITLSILGAFAKFFHCCKEQ